MMDMSYKCAVGREGGTMPLGGCGGRERIHMWHSWDLPILDLPIFSDRFSSVQLVSTPEATLSVDFFFLSDSIEGSSQVLQFYVYIVQHHASLVRFAIGTTGTTGTSKPTR